MFNFKKYNYDSLDEHFKILEKKITRLKLDNEVMKSEYYFVSEYIAPRINAVLPKDYKISREYYLIKTNSENYVQFNQEYFQHFKDNFWTFEHIWDTLHDPSLSRNYESGSTTKIKNMPGFGWGIFPYFLMISIIIFSLFYNTISKPWTSEIVSNTTQTLESNEIKDYQEQVSYINYKGEQLLKLNRQSDGNWQQLQPSINISYEFCKHPDNSTYLVIINNKLSKSINDCIGKGVVTPIAYPDVEFLISDFIPDNVIEKEGFSPNSNFTLEAGIKYNSKELGFIDPKFMIYRDYSIVTPNDLNIRMSGLVILSLIPILYAIYNLLVQSNFRRTLEKNKLTK